ncbi:MAG: hypothetical protein D6734_05165, partial [Candidatus Schekmanbacteria bacterium]
LVLIFIGLGYIFTSKIIAKSFYEILVKFIEKENAEKIIQIIMILIGVGIIFYGILAFIKGPEMFF